MTTLHTKDYGPVVGSKFNKMTTNTSLMNQELQYGTRCFVVHTTQIIVIVVHKNQTKNLNHIARIRNSDQFIYEVMP